MSVADNRVITSLKYSQYRMKPVIVNGEPVEISRVPYLVSIKEGNRRFEYEKILWTNLCGGSIIGPKKVVSAAHCFEGNHFYYASHPERLRVVAGNSRTDILGLGTEDSTDETQWRRIQKVVIHNDFVFPTNDIALVFIKGIWNFTGIVDYIVPAARTVDYNNTCASAGYGKMGHRLGRDSPSPILLLAQIKVLTRWQCSVLWQMNMNTFVCTNNEFGDVAQGDSGGPLACHDTADPEEIPGKDILVGVVSGKNFDKTTLYTRVSAYHDWIERNCSCEIAAFVLDIKPLLLIYLLLLSS